MVDYCKINVNPKNRKTGDCVIRALTVAIHDENGGDIKKEYKQVLTELYMIALKTGYMVNSKQAYEKFLENHGFIKYKQPRKADNTKYKVGEINKAIKFNCSPTYTENSVCVISCANHLTVYTNVLIDIWDCRNKSIGNYWVKW